MNRIIFHDVDSVLNNRSWAMEKYDKRIRVYRDWILYLSKCCLMCSPI